MDSRFVEIQRRDTEDGEFFQIKDPAVVKLPDGTYVLYCTLDASYMKPGLVGRFTAAAPEGPWQEEAPAELSGVSGPEVCAPAVVMEEKDGKPLFKMYIQTSCFHEDGVIAVATSTDGIHFTAEKTVMTKDDVRGSVSLYDVAVSDITHGGKPAECMVFSAYREIGCGDVYISMRDKGAAAWEQPVLALRQEDVPFHNKPGSENFEWGLEGAKVVQLADDAYLMAGVCFLDGETSARGTRQRVFFAAASSPLGPFVPMNTPIDPTPYKEGTGENGHPDIIDLGDKLGILYQERAGEGRDKPWHLRYARADKAALLKEVRARLAPPVRGKTSKPGFGI
ncbi:MAG: hypothetical protein ACAH83_08155 [Alphaproteobacteria bacterium]